MKHGVCKRKYFSGARFLSVLSAATFQIARCLSVQTSALSYSAAPPSAGIYLHIPFCRRRCHYCDFSIKVIGDKESRRRSSGEYYTELLLRDIDHWTRLAGAEGTKVDTIYFGGGTPSLLPNECIDRILQRLRSTFTMDPLSEVTLEMDPGTFNYERLLALRGSGVNRISMGVQSFDSAMLKHCGRPHSVEDTYRAVEDLHRASWDNFSIDLISSLPHLTAELWQDTLVQAAKIGSAHISVYDLQVEPGTAFARWYTPGVSPLPSEEIGADMYRNAVRTLGAAGFEHYEVSNYAQPGMRSRHNLKYWQCAPVMAFGMSAASYWGNQRFSRPRTMLEYEQYVQSLQDQQLYVQSAVAAQDGAPDVYDKIMLALRTSDGLDLRAFQNAYGLDVTQKVVDALRGFTECGLVRLGGTASGEPERARLSDPEGLLVSNDVISSVFAALPSEEPTAPAQR